MAVSISYAKLHDGGIQCLISMGATLGIKERYNLLSLSYSLSHFKDFSYWLLDFYHGHFSLCREYLG